MHRGKPTMRRRTWRRCVAVMRQLCVRLLPRSSRHGGEEPWSVLPPESWYIVARDLWCLPDHEARTLWTALAQSTRTRPQAMRQRFALAGLTHISNKFWQDFCAPAAVMSVLEDLCAERRLTRQRATKIEEVVLRHITADGDWRGERRRGAERTSTLPPDVTTFAETGTTR